MSLVLYPEDSCSCCGDPHWRTSCHGKWWCDTKACIRCALESHDSSACYASFFLGSGSREDGKLARLRRLTGAHGLRPIRVRLVGYLVTPIKDVVWKCVTCCTPTVDTLLVTLSLHGGRWKIVDGRFVVTRWPKLPWQPKDAAPRLPWRVPYNPYA
jgi:hypothetical protein